MNKLEAVFMEGGDGDLKKVSSMLDKLEAQTLQYAPWPAYPYHPEVKFCISHSNDHLFLKYYVDETSIRALTGKLNGPVWEDSCVEFFISFDEGGYYNFEFNCIGTTLAAFGQGRNGRELLPVDVLQNIRYLSMITNTKINGLVHWELILVLPVSVFFHHSITSLRGINCRANFFKCGDLLPQPHFLSWMPIISEEPDFHQPQFFGGLMFR